jgi:hypothetical protein
MIRAAVKDVDTCMEDVLREGQVMEVVFQAFQSYENIVLKHTKTSPLTGLDVFGRIMPDSRDY